MMPPELVWMPVVEQALREDLGRAGDVTTMLTVPERAQARAALRTRAAGTIAGLPMALHAFRLLGPGLHIEVAVPEGAAVAAGTVVATIEGPARPILTAERTALNLLTRLCGIATCTNAAVAAVRDTGTRIAATRKTTPCLRALEKYAVAVAGGLSHRYGLDDAILIKDNHIAAAGGILAAVDAALAGKGHMLKLQVEVDDLGQLETVLTRAIDAVLLDNMPPPTLREAVGMVAGRCLTEASGGLRLEQLAAVAATGVDLISLGWLTHSAPQLDLGLDIEL